MHLREIDAHPPGEHGSRIIRQGCLHGCVCFCSHGLAVLLTFGEEHPGDPSCLSGLGHTGTMRPAALPHALQPAAAGPCAGRRYWVHDSEGG